MKMILEMKYRREKRLIYSKSEIYEPYLSEDISPILSRNPYLSNTGGFVISNKLRDYILINKPNLAKIYSV